MKMYMAQCSRIPACYGISVSFFFEGTILFNDSYNYVDNIYIVFVCICVY